MTVRKLKCPFRVRSSADPCQHPWVSQELGSQKVSKLENRAANFAVSKKQNLHLSESKKTGNSSDF